MSVGIVLISHSDLVARGTRDIAGQMAPNIKIVAAGGTAEGGIGTDFNRVFEAIGLANTGEGVVVFGDLGSALLVAESVIDFTEKGDVRVAKASFVEGAVAAAVAAEIGSNIDGVLLAAESSTGGVRWAKSVVSTDSPEKPHEDITAVGDSSDGSAEIDRAHMGTNEIAADSSLGVMRLEVVLVNDEGLHARPAADFARLAGRFNAEISVNGIDAKSLLGIMALGLTRGQTVKISARGEQAAVAIHALRSLIESGFDQRLVLE